MRLLIVDNYDSFTYNLFQLLYEAGCNDITVMKNDKIAMEQVEGFDKIVFSPGPGLPGESPVMGEILYAFERSKSILGVCLGHQAIGCFYGGTLMNHQQAYHGISSELIITDPNEKLFRGINGSIRVGRYHSWSLEEATLPSCLHITSRTESGDIMSIAHRQYDIRGVQFHPESYITSYGEILVRNWLNFFY